MKHMRIWLIHLATAAFYDDIIVELSAKALFIVKFQLKNMGGNRNITFSKIPMRALFHFKGFRSKYWLLDDKTNTCMGWATIADAERYSKSIAMKFMKKRSVEGSISFRIHKIGGE